MFSLHLVLGFFFCRWMNDKKCEAKRAWMATNGSDDHIFLLSSQHLLRIQENKYRKHRCVVIQILWRISFMCHSNNVFWSNEWTNLQWAAKHFTLELRTFVSLLQCSCAIHYYLHGFLFDGSKIRFFFQYGYEDIAVCRLIKIYKMYTVNKLSIEIAKKNRGKKECRWCRRFTLERYREYIYKNIMHNM